MRLKSMYDGQSGSPITYLANAITDTDTSITVTDISTILAPPNILTIQNDEDFETIYYTEISGNVISGISRGFDTTTAQTFEAESIVSRKFTAYDQSTIHENINILAENIEDFVTVVVGTSTEGHTTAEVDYICNGTNDEVTINEAIQSLKGIDGKIKCKFLSGTYNISGSINIDIDNLTIEMGEDTIIFSGMAESSTTITNILTRNKIFTVNANNTIFSGGQIKNQQSSNIAIYCESGSIANIENINVVGVACGIAINTDSELVSMADNIFSISGLGTGTCGVYNAGTTGDISGDWTFTSSSTIYGVRNNSSSTTGDISGNWTITSSSGIVYSVYNYSSSTTGDISGNWTITSISSIYGVYNSSSTTGDISGNWTITSSVYSGTSAYGVYSNSSSTTGDISGNWTVSRGASTYGVYSSGTTGDISGDWTVSNVNTSGVISTYGVYSSGTTGDISGDWTVSGKSTNSTYGVSISASLQNNIIIFNTKIKSTYGTDGSSTGYSIRVSDTNTLSTYIITNNVLQKEPTTSGSATFDVRDNIITG